MTTSRERPWLYLGIALSGVASLLVLPLSVLAVLLHVIGLAATTRMDPVVRRWMRPLLVVTGLCSLGAMTRFVLSDALSGIVEARGRDSSARAVSVLREILFAEDAMRRYAFIDPDGDRIGSAGTLGELTGAHGARQGKPVEIPPLSPRLMPGASTRTGPALEQGGYYFVVCLPGPGGTWATGPRDPVDDEAAERRFVAYAWPTTADAPHFTAFFMDEHERILESSAKVGSKPRLVGASAAPACDDALLRPEIWRPWRGKQPRTSLPGDHRRL